MQGIADIHDILNAVEICGILKAFVDELVQGVEIQELDAAMLIEFFAAEFFFDDLIRKLGYHAAVALGQASDFAVCADEAVIAAPGIHADGIQLRAVFFHIKLQGCENFIVVAIDIPVVFAADFAYLGGKTVQLFKLNLSVFQRSDDTASAFGAEVYCKVTSHISPPLRCAPAYRYPADTGPVPCGLPACISSFPRLRRHGWSWRRR